MEGRSVKHRTQRILVTGLTALITGALGRLFANRFAKEAPPPQQRTLADDTKEALSHAVASVIAVVVASAIVRRLAGGSQA
jgi:hypothetical protein